MTKDKKFEEGSSRPVTFDDKARTDSTRQLIWPHSNNGDDQALFELSAIPRAACVPMAIIKTQEDVVKWLMAPDINDDGTPKEPISVPDHFLHWFAIFARGQDRQLIEELIKIAGTSGEAMRNLPGLGGGLGGGPVLGREW